MHSVWHSIMRVMHWAPHTSSPGSQPLRQGSQDALHLASHPSQVAPQRP